MMTELDSHPVLNCAAARDWERHILLSEDEEWSAMRAAGTAIAAAVSADCNEIGGLPDDARLLVIVGKGHNGGDALLAGAALLGARPRARADVILAFGAANLRPLAHRALSELQRTVGRQAVLREPAAAQIAQNTYDVCLDGLFGFQFRPPVEGVAATLIDQVNRHPAIRLRAAVDLPSGVGETPVAVAFRADFTYATGIVKTPILAPENAAQVGRVRYLDLDFFARGQPVPPASERILLPSVLAPLSALRSPLTDKRTFGHLAVIGGSQNYPGAILLAVRAALRSGVGLVTAFVPERLAPEFAAHHPEVMWVGCPVTATGGLGGAALTWVRERSARATAVLVGPGLGPDAETLAWVQELAGSSAIPLVFDADALQPQIVAAAGAMPFICTPHAGEYKRIEGALYAEGKWAAEQGVLVLKGPITRVTAGRETYFSLHGGPVLARGGSGDMLAGLIGGLLAQTPDEPLLAAARGVMWHGLAADLLARAHGQVAVENSQLLEQLGPALNSTHARLPDGNAGVHDSERPAEHRPDHAKPVVDRTGGRPA